MDDLTSSEAMYNKHKHNVDENHLLLKINRKKKKKDKENPVTIHHGIYIVTYNWSDGMDTTFKDKNVV
jgi:hypothetical protein